MKTLVDSPVGFATRLKRSRESTGLSLRQAAEQITGVSHQHLSLMERGERYPSLPMLIRMGAIYQVTPLFLLDGDGASVCPLCQRPFIGTLEEVKGRIERSEGAMTLNKDGVIVAASKGVARMLGLPQEEIRDRSASDFVLGGGHAGSVEEAGIAQIKHPVTGEVFRLAWHVHPVVIEGEEYEVVDGWGLE